MQTCYVKNKDDCYRKPGLAICRGCGAELTDLSTKAFKAILRRDYNIRRYCSPKCLTNHKAVIASGAPERVKAFLEKKASQENAQRLSNKISCSDT